MTIHLNFIVEPVVFTFEFLVFITLLRIQIVETRLVGIIDFLDLLLISLQLVFHVFLFCKQSVEVGLLLIVLVLYMHEKIFDVLGFSVTSVLIQGQVIICQLTLVLSNIFNEHFVSTF